MPVPITLLLFKACVLRFFVLYCRVLSRDCSLSGYGYWLLTTIVTKLHYWYY